MVNLNDLKSKVGGSWLRREGEDFIPISQVLIDTRKLLFTGEALFIAIRGVRNNSHDFLLEAWEAGIRNFVVEHGNYKAELLEKLSGSNILETENGIVALQFFAALHRKSYSLFTLAITGSNGKTIIKEWLAHLMKERFSIVRSPRSYNSQTGVPLSVLQIREFHQLGIFEAGISEPGEMQALEAIIQPNSGIFTLLGEAHDEGFRSRKHKLEEKAKLFDHCNQVLYCADQELVNESFQEANTRQEKKRFFAWSRVNREADFFLEVAFLAQQTQLKCGDIQVSIPNRDEASVWNACTCLAYLAMRGWVEPQILQRFTDLPVLDMRLQLKEVQQHCKLINDSYSADLGSFMLAIEFLQQQAQQLKRTVILSDFLETGRTETDLYTAIAEQLRLNHIDTFYGIGPAMVRNQGLFKVTRSRFFNSVGEFLNQVHLQDFHEEIILLKGARSFAFERIGQWLEKKVHQTVFEVSLNALVHNLNTYRKMLKPGTKVMAMVKAFSYGAGSDEIARILHFNRVDYLTVAYADEGVTLRKSGIRTPIMVMNPHAGSFDAILQYSLDPEVYNLSVLTDLLKHANGAEIGIHIELDTGMKRLGFDEKDIPELIKVLAENPNLVVRSVFTHLASSENPDDDTFTRSQIDLFENLSSGLQSKISYPFIRHCLNSAGIARFPDAQYDMVRLGIGLYGADPANLNLQLQPIGTLKTVVSQIREINPGESIGYGRKGLLPEGGKIAIVAIGYADGLDRKLSNGNGFMSIGGNLVPIVGNICMDMTMLDITGLNCEVGDEVIVFGEKPSLLQVADWIGTIPYEVLTGISQRVKRVYFYE